MVPMSWKNFARRGRVEFTAPWHADDAYAFCFLRLRRKENRHRFGFHDKGWRDKDRATDFEHSSNFVSIFVRGSAAVMRR